MLLDWSLIAYSIGLSAAAIGAVWSLAWWFARQFTLIRNIIYETKDAIINKLEYHEKLDDSRFTEVRKEIFDIRLRNARLDGNRENKDNAN